MSTTLCGHARPYDLCHECAALRQVREQYGKHQIRHAADGGCQICPLGPMDPIHFVRPS